MRPLEILVVDDAKSIRLLLKEILDEINANVTEAVNGLEAFNFIITNKYDLVFMDIHMPGQSGLEVIDKVRNVLNIKNLPIIVITELTRDDLIREAFQLGANDYIRKPLHPDEVIARLKVRFDNYELLHQLKYAKDNLEKANFDLHKANEEIFYLKEKEKENIYRATVYGTQHILNNLLNQLALVKKEIDINPSFNQGVTEKFVKMTDQARDLVEKLASVEEVEENRIKDSVYPKE